MLQRTLIGRGTLFLAGNVFLKFAYRKLNYYRVAPPTLQFFFESIKKIEVKIRKLIKRILYCTRFAEV